MDELDQSKVAYESAPKERSRKEGMSGKKQFPGKKMPQGDQDVNPVEPANPSLKSDSEMSKSMSKRHAVQKHKSSSVRARVSRHNEYR